MKQYERLKRACALLVCMACTTVFFAGCGGQGASGTPVSGTEDSALQEPKEDESGKLLDKELTIEMLVQENAYAPISQDCAVLKAIYDKTNVKLVLKPVPASDYGTKASMYMATNNLPDAMAVGTGNIKDYARSGMFLNLSEYKEYMPNYMKALNQPERKADAKSLYLDGNLYSFARLEKFRIGTATCPMIRADLLEEQDIPMPTTWDEFYQVMLKVKEKHPDMYAMSSRMGTNYLLGQLAFPLGSGGFEEFKTNNGVYYEPDEDKYLYGPIQPDFKRVVEFVHNMYEDGLLDPDYAVMTRDICWEKLSSGKLFAYYDNDTFAARTFNPALREVDPNARFEMIAPMVNPEGTTRSLRYQRDWLGHNVVISSKVDRPEDVVKFFDWMYSEEGTMITNFGVEGETYYMENGEPIIAPELLERHKNADDVISSIYSEIGAGSNNFALYVDESWFKQTSDPLMVECGERIDQWTEEGKMMSVRNSLELCFTEEDMQRLKTLDPNVMTLFNQEIDKFILGKRPMSEWDAFAKELAEQGATEIEEIYNRAYDKVKSI